jgi:LPXTG-motif cell wall-anchored protein
VRTRPIKRHRFSAGRVLVVIGLLLGAIGVATAAQAIAAPGAPAQTPVPGNPTCAELAPDGTTWTELKYEPVVDGQDSDGTLTVTVDVHPNEDTGPTFDWSSNIGVDAVFVKGGPGGNLYLYDEATGDTGLHAPINPANDKYYGLSHLSFCYDTGDGTTTTTEPTTTTTDPTTTTTEPTTTTTEPTTSTTEPTTSTTGPTTTTTGPTTSTTEPATTTTEPTTTTTAPGAVPPSPGAVPPSPGAVPPSPGAVPPSPPGAAPDVSQPLTALPRTGSGTGPALILSGLLLAVGVSLVACSRRLRHAA